MRNPHAAAIAAAALLAMSAGAVAEQPDDERDATLNPGGPGGLDLDLEAPAATDMEPMTFSPSTCAADLQLQHYEDEPKVHVTATLRNSQCGPSAGNFTVVVNYRDEDGGDLQTAEFEQKWQRSNAQPLIIERAYPLGKGLDIINVRSKGLSCKCTGEAEAGK